MSAGAVPIRENNGKWEFLLLRSFKYWDFPKGMVELGEDPWLAAVREVAEETGLTKFSLPFGKEFIETLPYAKGKVARYYIIQIEEEKEIELIPNPVTGVVEHHEHRWVTFEKAKKLLVPRVCEVLMWAEDFIRNQSPHQNYSHG